MVHCRCTMVFCDVHMSVFYKLMNREVTQVFNITKVHVFQMKYSKQTKINKSVKSVLGSGWMSGWSVGVVGWNKGKTHEKEHMGVCVGGEECELAASPALYMVHKTQVCPILLIGVHSTTCPCRQRTKHQQGEHIYICVCVCIAIGPATVHNVPRAGWCMEGHDTVNGNCTVCDFNPWCIVAGLM